MPNESSSPPGDQAPAVKPGAAFTIAGLVQQEQAENAPRDVQLQAFVFDPGGRFLGTGEVDARGNFKADLKLARPIPVEIVIAPPGDPQEARRSSAQRQQVAAADWIAEGTNFRLKPTLQLRPDLLQIFRPLSICVSGHVRKVFQRDGETQLCPVAYAKVEVFDVDREGCWWPFLFPHLDRIANRRVLRAPELLKLPTRPLTATAAPDRARLDRLDLTSVTAAASDPNQLRVGELKTLAPALASRLENLTLTSLIAPWIYFPRCFHSKALVCEAFTDCSGYFNCCFDWSIFHTRRGRLRFDGRPDIIVRVTQVINGVQTVIYMDPYTSTRWNVTNAHIDLYLDNDEVVCGSCTGAPLPGNSRASLLQIGSDPVWLVDQADGRPADQPNGRFKTPPYSNGAFGGSLYLRGNFTADLLTGSPRRYYKLSWAPAGSSSFTPIQTTLSALRSAPGGIFETYLLGPQPPGSPVAGLYEVQDANHWWMMPGTPGGSGMVLGLWDTSFEADQGAYVLRMEVYDQAGAKITTMQFDRHAGNGTGVDTVTTTTDHLDLTFHIDNKPLELQLTTPATNDCGVVPWSPTLNLTLHVHAEQENGRVHSWALEYVRGVTVTRHALSAGEHNAGIANVDVDVNANDLLAGLTTTCAFALILSATSHVRGNSGFIYYGEKIYAIAIEKCARG